MQQSLKASKETASNSVFTFFLMSLTSRHLLSGFFPLWYGRKLAGMRSGESNEWLSSTGPDKVFRRCGSVLLLLIHENECNRFHTFPLSKISMKNLTDYFLFSVQLILHQF